MTVQKISKTENIIKVSPEDTLGHMFSLLSSSHDSAFVFDNDHFLGVVNPYYCLIKKSYPANTKAKHCLVHPPKVDIKYHLKKVAQLMIDSKIHYLPVFSNDKFYGFISARRILSSIIESEELKHKIGDYLKQKKPLISVYETDFISRALALFKQYRISKLVVISKDFKLKGVLAYFDLISYLVTPKQKQHLSAREGNKTPILNRQVKNFAKTNVLTLTTNDRLSQAADMILKNSIGSVIIIDAERHPLGIVTTKDLLSIFARRHQLAKLEVITKSLSKQSWVLVSQFIKQINHQLAKFKDISNAKFFVKEKEGGGVFRAALSILLKNNRIKVIKEEGKNLGKVLQEVKKKSK